jgi:hypothetical protein
VVPVIKSGPWLLADSSITNTEVVKVLLVHSIIQDLALFLKFFVCALVNMNGWESKEEKWPNPCRLTGVFVPIHTYIHTYIHTLLHPMDP